MGQMAISIRDREVLNALREHGDALTQPREIVHWAYFPTSASRTLFVDASRRMGFEINGTSDPNEKSREFGARVSHVDIPGEEIIERVAASLSELAERCGGDYDGWETQVT
jgi:regulator of RNase E activity RraB